MCKGEIGKFQRAAVDNLANGASDEALMKAMQALAAAQEAKDQNAEAACLCTIVDVRLARKEYDTALRSASEAVALFKATGNKLSAATAASKVIAIARDVKGASPSLLAQAHFARGERKAALAQAKEAVGAKADKKEKLESFLLIAEVHLADKAAKEATEAAAEALAASKEVGDKKFEAAALCATASAKVLGGDLKEALKAAREALLMAHENDDKENAAAARAICAQARPKTETEKMLMEQQMSAPKAIEYQPKRPNPNCLRGFTAPACLKESTTSTAKCIMGVGGTNHLSGIVCCVTGASRGLGKGISQELARAGGIVYVTGRSSPSMITDQLLGGTVDETAAGLRSLGGVGIATHVDHAHMPQNQALSNLISQHGRLDVLVNNAFYIPKPDLIFFGTPVWMQPLRFLNEQIAVGGFNHVAESLIMTPLLRRGKGCIINISSWGSQHNIGVFPVSYFVNKAAFDFTMNRLGDELRKCRVFSVTLWPGSVKSERSIMGAKRTGTMLTDLETTRFTGRAVVELAKMSPVDLAQYSHLNRTVSSSDLNVSEIDGYLHEPNLHTFTQFGSVPAPKAMHLW